MISAAFRRARLATGCTLLPLLATAALADAPLLAVAADSVTIPFDNAAPNGGPLTGSPQISAGFNGGPKMRFTMDTGSTGIVVSTDHFQPQAGQKPVGPGQMTYTSSGIVLKGNLFMTSVEIGAGPNTATAVVPVLQVTSMTCTTNARHCTPNPSPKGVAMFGVAFGQENAGQPNGTPDANPFLNIKQIGGKPALVSRGYIVTSAGATLGLTTANTQGFNRVQLTKDATVNDWTRAPVTVTAGGATGTGTVLNDTGVASMYLTPAVGAKVPTIPAGQPAVPACAKDGPCAAPGAVIKVAIGDPAAPAASYSFTVGANGGPDPASPASPSWVTVLTNKKGVSFVNTSYHFFNAFDYAYDYTNGAVGYRAVARK